MPTRVCDRAEHRAEDGSEDGGAERDPDQLAAALAGRGDGQPGERAGPRRRARGALDEACEPERPGAFCSGEREAGGCEEHESGDDGALRAPAERREPAGDAAEQRAGAEGGDEQPGAGLREPELVRVPGNQRRERPEQHRVDEHDRGDENKQATHDPTLPTASSQPAPENRPPTATRPLLKEPRERSDPLGVLARQGAASRGPLVPNAPKIIQRAGCAFVPRSDELSASAYGLPDRTRPTRVPCSLQEGT